MRSEYVRNVGVTASETESIRSTLRVRMRLCARRVCELRGFAAGIFLVLSVSSACTAANKVGAEPDIDRMATVEQPQCDCAGRQ